MVAGNKVPASDAELARITFRSLHSNGGWDASYIYMKVKVIQRLLSNCGVQNVLDVGSSTGVGKYPALALENVALSSVYFVHIDLDLEAFASADFGRPRSHYLCADAERLPIREYAIDILFLSEILEHLPRPEEALDECVRVQSLRGKLVIFTPNAPKWLKFLKKRRHPLTEKVRKPLLDHISEYSLRELRESLRKRGLVLHDTVGFNFVFIGPLRLVVIALRKVLNRLSRIASLKFHMRMSKIAGRLPALSDQVMVVAEKAALK